MALKKTFVKPLPRIHVLIRRGSDRAVVLRQGGTKVFCSIGWDLVRDEFAVGQWCKHKIYPHRCDISSDGRWMVYFALNGQWKSKTAGSWTALSRAPYLRAIALWPQGDTWGGGGLLYDAPHQLGDFAREWTVDPRPLATRVPYPPYPETGHPTVEHWRIANGFPLHHVDSHNRLKLGGAYWTRLERDGWTNTSKGTGWQKQFEKPLGHGWVLCKIVVNEPLERHELRAPDGAIEKLPDWQWAELDEPRHRVLWAVGGLIYAAGIFATGLGTATPVFDARNMTFENIRAPYHDTEPTIYG